MIWRCRNLSWKAIRTPRHHTMKGATTDSMLLAVSPHRCCPVGYSNALSPTKFTFQHHSFMKGHSYLPSLAANSWIPPTSPRKSQTPLQLQLKSWFRKSLGECTSHSFLSLSSSRLSWQPVSGGNPLEWTPMGKLFTNESKVGNAAVCFSSLYLHVHILIFLCRECFHKD